MYFHLIRKLNNMEGKERNHLMIIWLCHLT